MISGSSHWAARTLCRLTTDNQRVLKIFFVKYKLESYH